MSGSGTQGTNLAHVQLRAIPAVVGGTGECAAARHLCMGCWVRAFQVRA